MGISVEQWRVSVGVWNAKIRLRTPGGVVQAFSEEGRKLFIAIVAMALIVISGLEVNPGPATIDDVIKKLDIMDVKLSEMAKVTTNLQEQIINLNKKLEDSRNENLSLKQ